MRVDVTEFLSLSPQEGYEEDEVYEVYRHHFSSTPSMRRIPSCLPCEVSSAVAKICLPFSVSLRDRPRPSLRRSTPHFFRRRRGPKGSKPSGDAPFETAVISFWNVRTRFSTERFSSHSRVRGSILSGRHASRHAWLQYFRFRCGAWNALPQVLQIIVKGGRSWRFLFLALFLHCGLQYTFSLFEVSKSCWQTGHVLCRVILLSSPYLFLRRLWA